MKIGFRTPSLKGSFKAGTASKYKKQLKSAINPTYGKEGANWFKNPKKALHNKIYNKATESISDILK